MTSPRSSTTPSDTKKNPTSGSVNAMVGTGVSMRTIEWTELKIDQKNPLLGKGSFGFVFRGTWKESRQAVPYKIAVKVK